MSRRRTKSPAAGPPAPESRRRGPPRRSPRTRTAGAPGNGAARDLAARAAELDTADELGKLRDRFTLPDGVVYLDGNSLGALTTGVAARLAQVITHEWGTELIQSWSTGTWWTAPERIGDKLSPLIGAAPGQTVVGDSTSVNLFKALVGAARLARPGRTQLLVDASTFPTDGYIAASAARMTGLTVVPVDPSRAAESMGRTPPSSSSTTSTTAPAASTTSRPSPRRPAPPGPSPSGTSVIRPVPSPSTSTSTPSTSRSAARTST